MICHNDVMYSTYNILLDTDHLYTVCSLPSKLPLDLLFCCSCGSVLWTILLPIVGEALLNGGLTDANPGPVDAESGSAGSNPACSALPIFEIRWGKSTKLGSIPHRRHFSYLNQ
jgi:hypothetical protein